MFGIWSLFFCFFSFFLLFPLSIAFSFFPYDFGVRRYKNGSHTYSCGTHVTWHQSMVGMRTAHLVIAEYLLSGFIFHWPETLAIFSYSAGSPTKFTYGSINDPPRSYFLYGMMRSNSKNFTKHNNFVSIFDLVQSCLAKGHKTLR